jgi:hypothetical protein
MELTGIVYIFPTTSSDHDFEVEQDDTRAGT